MPPKTQKRTIQKSKPLNKKWAAIIVAVVALVGAYFLFFAKAAANNCSTLYPQSAFADNPSYQNQTVTVDGQSITRTKPPVDDTPPTAAGQICDINQASNGTDSVASKDNEVNQLAAQGWVDWGVGFRAPSTSIDGALPVHRFFNASLTAHFLVIESDPNYAKLKSDPANVDEGIYMYAWDNPNRIDTEPVYRVNRKPLYFLQMYSTNKAWVDQFVNNPDGTWENGGIAFYAFSGSYVPPTPGAPAKDTDCPNQQLKVNDKGTCVQQLKGILNGYVAFHGDKSPRLDENDKTFDTTTSNYTRLFVTALKSKGVTVADYNNVVTTETWNALLGGYPPSAVPPATPTTPAPTTPTPDPMPSPVVPTPPATPLPTTPGGGKNTPPVAETPQTPVPDPGPPPVDPGKNPTSEPITTYAPLPCPDYKVAAETQGKGVFGLPLNPLCIVSYQKIAQENGLVIDLDGKWSQRLEIALKLIAKRETIVPDTPQPTPAPPAVTQPGKEPGQKKPFGYIDKLPSTKSANKRHVNVYILAKYDEPGKENKTARLLRTKKEIQDAQDKILPILHIICDIYMYNNLGSSGVWVYSGGNLQKGGDQEKCSVTKNNGNWDNFKGKNFGPPYTGGFPRHAWITGQLANDGYPKIKYYTGPGTY